MAEVLSRAFTWLDANIVMIKLLSRSMASRKVVLSAWFVYGEGFASFVSGDSYR